MKLTSQIFSATSRTPTVDFWTALAEEFAQ